MTTRLLTRIDNVVAAVPMLILEISPSASLSSELSLSIPDVSPAGAATSSTDAYNGFTWYGR